MAFGEALQVTLLKDIKGDRATSKFIRENQAWRILASKGEKILVEHIPRIGIVGHRIPKFGRPNISFILHSEDFSIFEEESDAD